MDLNISQEEKEKLWNEVSAERAASTVSTVQAAAKPIDTEENKDGDTEAAAAAAAATDDSAAGDKPAGEESTATEDQAADQNQENKPGDDQAKDPVAELVARIDALERRTRNAEGHIGNLNSTQQKLQTLVTAAQSAAATVKDAPTDEQVRQAVSNPADWEDLKGEFPAWAKATEALLDARLAPLQGKGSFDPAAIEKIVTDRVKGETEAVRKEVVNSALDAVFPGWEDEVKTQQFGNWLQAQPESTKTLAASSRVGDAAKMLRLYGEAMQANPAQQLTQRRQEVLGNSVAAPKGGTKPPAKSVDDMSPEELWDYEAKLREKRRGA